ncbi:MAG: phage holin family protein [Pedosphaera sp.]|nr:phage holin family protein [Pedosphaera sp.]
MDAIRSSGVVGTVARVFDMAMATVQNRVELFSVELREEKYRIIEAMLLAGAVLALGMMTITLLTLALVMLFSESARLIALSILGLIYLTVTIVGACLLRTRLKNWVSFQGTIGEIKKDRSCLENLQNCDASKRNS